MSTVPSLVNSSRGVISTSTTSFTCRIGHEYQWTNSKAADGLAASWNCTVPFDVHESPNAVHIGVYAIQANQPPALVSRSSSFLSVVSSSLRCSQAICQSLQCLFTPELQLLNHVLFESEHMVLLSFGRHKHTVALQFAGICIVLINTLCHRLYCHLLSDVLRRYIAVDQSVLSGGRSC